MAAGRRRILERLDGLLEPREDVGLADGLEACDLALQVLDATERLGPHDPMGLLVEGDDAELVPLRQRRRGAQDRLLADVDLADAAHADPAAALAAVERVAVAGVHRAGLVDHDDERDVGLLLTIADAHIDRQGLLERGLLVAAGAVRIGAADHDQTPADVPHVDLQCGELAVGQPRTGHIDQHHAVVRRQRAEVGREGLGDHDVDLLALRDQCLHELVGDDLVAGQHERPRLALDDRDRVSPVVLAEGVLGGFDDDAERVQPGLFRRHVERDAGHPFLESHPFRGDVLAAREQPHRGRLPHRRADVGGDLDGLAEVGGRWGRDPLDEDLVPAAEPDRAGLDADVARRGERRLGLTAARGVVAVRQQHDALLGVVGEQRGRQAQGAPDVGRAADGRRREPVDLRELGRQPLDERLLAERDDAGQVAFRDLGQRLAQERQGLVASLGPDRIGHVHDEHRRQAIDRQDEPEPGQREDQRRQQDRADEQCDAAAADPHPPARAEVQADGQRHDRDQQEQRERRVEADAHQAVVPAPRPRRVARERRTRTRPSRW